MCSFFNDLFIFSGNNYTMYRKNRIGNKDFHSILVIVSGNNCYTLGQRTSASPLYGRYTTYVAPCEIEKQQVLCTDNEPGRFYNRLTLHNDIKRTKAEAEELCTNQGKV